MLIALLIQHWLLLGIWWLNGKESACNVGDLGLIPGLGRSVGGGHGNPLQYSCLENPYGQRNLAGYSPQGHKESNVTEATCQGMIYTFVKGRSDA